MDKTAVSIIIAVVLVSALLFVWFYGFGPKVSVKPVAIPEGIILFYGQGCPHCKIVDDFVTANKIEDKVKFSRLEVWYDKNNQVILTEVAVKCAITTNQVGVPFLYDPPSGEAGGNGKCYVGDQDVINFFKNAANIQ